MKRIFTILAFAGILVSCSNLEDVDRRSDDVYFSSKDRSDQQEEKEERENTRSVDYYDPEVAEQMRWERLTLRDGVRVIRYNIYDDETYYERYEYDMRDRANDPSYPRKNKKRTIDMDDDGYSGDEDDKRDRDIDGSDNSRRR